MVDAGHDGEQSFPLVIVGNRVLLLYLRGILVTPWCGIGSVTSFWMNHSYLQNVHVPWVITGEGMLAHLHAG